jgi:far upstream element-binding protein
LICSFCWPESGVEQQNSESSVEVAVEDSKAAPSAGAADAANGKATSDVDVQVAQTGSDDKPTEPTPEAATEAPQQEGDVASVGQEMSRKIEVPNSKVLLLTLCKYGVLSRRAVDLRLELKHF